ncbi:NUDIX domain-containing protein [Phascolarctobacterium sp.]|uniref:NUDIX domain-containing protein n=1 Tax=Phascolarctobacterium sp. TaxID=2049039 RepID=UPI003867C72D
MHFTYCPQCGNKLGKCEFGDDGFVPWCENCHQPFFDIFPIVTVTMVVNELGEVALLKPKYMTDKYYNFIAGYIKPGEQAEVCAAREVEEEIGIEPHDLQFMCSQWIEEQQLLLVGFAAHATKGQFTLSQELDKAEWVPAEDALFLVYPKGNITYTMLERYLEEKKHAD